jgi:hypothetical protein
VGRVIPELDELVSYLENQIDTCQTHWQNVSKNLKIKLAPLLESIEKPNVEERMCADLMQYLVTGEPSIPLAKYITKEISDCKIIPKLDDVIINNNIDCGNVIKEYWKHSRRKHG